MEDGISLIIGGGVAGSLITAVTTMVTAKLKQKREIQNPLNVRITKEFVPRHEFDAHVERNERSHENMFGRITEKDKEVAAIAADVKTITKVVDRIEHKLDGMKGGNNNG